MEDRKISLLIDYIERGEKESEKAVADLLLPEPLCPYYRGKADAFREVLGFVKALKSDK